MLLDVEVLQQSCGGDEEFARELLGEYRQRADELIELMRRSWNEGQPEEVRKAAHELKGSSLTLGALELAQLSRQLEDGCKNGQLQQISEWLGCLEEQAKALFQHLEKLRYL